MTDPTPSDHIARYIEFKRKAERLLASPAELDVGIICLFYAAVHIAQAYLLTKNVRFLASNHGDRSRALKASPELKPMWDAYSLLRAHSEDVRYDPTFQAATSHVTDAQRALARCETVLKSKLIKKNVPVP